MHRLAIILPLRYAIQITNESWTILEYLYLVPDAPLRVTAADLEESDQLAFLCLGRSQSRLYELPVVQDYKFVNELTNFCCWSACC